VPQIKRSGLVTGADQAKTAVKKPLFIKTDRLYSWAMSCATYQEPNLPAKRRSF